MAMMLNEHGFDVRVFVHEAHMEFTLSKDNCCFCEGTIKWDGCSNWDFNADGVMPHFCGLEDIKDFHATMLDIFKLASERIPTWDAELAE